MIPNQICSVIFSVLIFLGDFIQLGEAITFRFNHPKEALRLKQVCAKIVGCTCIVCSTIHATVSPCP